MCCHSFRNFSRRVRRRLRFASLLSRAVSGQEAANSVASGIAFVDRHHGINSNRFTALKRAQLLSAMPRRRGAERYDTLPQLCRSYSISYAVIPTPNGSEFLQSVRERAADAIISVACPYILGRRLLSLPPRGCLNIHHAPLPRYRGMMPTFWQMFNGERSVGITIHYMSEKVDEGAHCFKIPWRSHLANL